MPQTNKTELLESLFPGIDTTNFLVRMIDALPGLVAILNQERRLLYTNKDLEYVISENEIESVFDLRPGEFFQCVNAQEAPGGCGTSETCEYCGALQALNQSRETGTDISSEFRLLSNTKGRKKSYHFRLTSSPFQSDNELFYLVILQDISAESRKAELERIFFHDILNCLGSLHGTINLIKEKGQTNPVYMDILEATYNSMFDTVNEQRQYTLAEQGELKVNHEEIHSEDILIECSLPFSENKMYQSKLEVEENEKQIVFHTDPALLSRVISNMIKNAMEASASGSTVRVGSELSNGHVRFWVHNQGAIPRDVQLQIFERSFSTKGHGRGLGTFSMKLIGESYLGGKVDFRSDEKDGTTFWIDLPSHP